MAASRQFFLLSLARTGAKLENFFYTFCKLIFGNPKSMLSRASFLFPGGHLKVPCYFSVGMVEF